MQSYFIHFYLVFLFSTLICLWAMLGVLDNIDFLYWLAIHRYSYRNCLDHHWISSSLIDPKQFWLFLVIISGWAYSYGLKYIWIRICATFLILHSRFCILYVLRRFWALLRYFLLVSSLCNLDLQSDVLLDCIYQHLFKDQACLSTTAIATPIASTLNSISYVMKVFHRLAYSISDIFTSVNWRKLRKLMGLNIH